jgi:hypothetical protein
MLLICDICCDAHTHHMHTCTRATLNYITHYERDAPLAHAQPAFSMLYLDCFFELTLAIPDPSQQQRFITTEQQEECGDRCSPRSQRPFEYSGMNKTDDTLCVRVSESTLPPTLWPPRPSPQTRWSGGRHL